MLVICDSIKKLLPFFNDSWKLGVVQLSSKLKYPLYHTAQRFDYVLRGWQIYNYFHMVLIEELEFCFIHMVKENLQHPNSILLHSSLNPLELFFDIFFKKNPFCHSLILKLFWIFWMPLDVKRLFIHVLVILEQDLYPQTV